MIGRLARRRCRPLYRQRLETRAQLPAIAGRIGEAVDVIDAHAVDQALGVQPEDQRMRILERLRMLHAQRGQFVDIEEAPPVDRIVGDAPRRKPIMLTREQAQKGEQMRPRPGEAESDAGNSGIHCPRASARRPRSPRAAACRAPAAALCRAGLHPRRSSRCRSRAHTGSAAHAAAHRTTRRSLRRPPCGSARCRRSGRGPRLRSAPTSLRSASSPPSSGLTRVGSITS